MKNIAEKIAITCVITACAGASIYLVIDSIKQIKMDRQRREEGRELISQGIKRLEGRIVFVDEERIPKEIGGGLAGMEVIFIEKEYLRVRSNGSEYDLMIDGTTPLHEGDSVQVNYFSQEDLRRFKVDGYACNLLNGPVFSRGLLNLALTSQIDGLIKDYRRIK